MYNFQNHSEINNSRENHYTILGINKNASLDEIKKAYRKLSLNYHPDRNAGDINKSELYKKINEAYRVLSDNIERKNYDLLNSFDPILHSVSNNIDPTNIDPTNIMNMLMNSPEASNLVNNLASKLPINAMMGMLSNDLFGSLSINNRGHNKNHNRSYNKFNFNNDNNDIFSQQKEITRPESIFETINITLLQAFTGCKIPITINKWKYECDTKFQQEETMYIDIPRGIDNNEIITLENKGNRINTALVGDVEIKILITNDTQFFRQGLDLIYKKTITLKESYCGFNFDLPYIDGREFKIKNEPGNIIPPNFRKIIPNLGLKRDNDIGNLIILFDVIYPKQFTQEQIERLEKIL